MIMDILNGYQNNYKDSLRSSDEFEVSHDECSVCKGAVMKPDEIEAVKIRAEKLISISTQNPKCNSNTVWTDILQDQLIFEGLLKNRPAHYKSRDHESYDKTLEYADSERNSKDSDVVMSEENSCELESKFVPFNHKYEEFVEVNSAEHMPAQKHNRSTVWTDILHDQLISEDFSLLKNRAAHFKNRGHKSYDNTLKYADSERNSKDADVMFEEKPCESESKCVPFKHKYKKFVKVPFKHEYQKFVKVNGAERATAQKINKVLHKTGWRGCLIYRIVKYVGIEKAMALLQLTEQIEESGGLMIKDNTRRRTPGGVYHHLLLNDKEITKEMLDKIFGRKVIRKDMKKLYAEQKNKSQRVKKRAIKTLKVGFQLQKTVCKKAKNMELSETLDEATPSSDITLMENDSSSLPASLTNKFDSELEEGEIDD